METLRGNGNEPIAFADDLIVVIRANSRKELEQKANNVTKTLEEWCEKQKLEFSTKKLEMLLLKGSNHYENEASCPIPRYTLRNKNEYHTSY